MKQGTKIIALFLITLFVSTVAFAQKGRTERIQALKKTYITDRVKLTPAQAEKFWPVYNHYEEDLKDLRQSFMKQNRKQNNNFSEKEARRYVEDNLDYQDALVDLKRKYKGQFLKVISAQQLADLYVAEREFRQMLIQKLRERRGKR